MSAISGINHYLSTPVPRNTPSANSPNSVQVFVQTHARAVWSGYFIYFGFKDLSYVYKQWFKGKKSKSLIDQKIDETAKNTLGSVGARGTFNLATGAAETVISLHGYGVISMKDKLNMFHRFSQVSFLLANIYSIVHCLSVIIEAQKLCKNANEHELKILRALQISSIMSILGSIGYIIAMIIALFACTLTGVAFIFMCVALTIGCIKFVYDMVEFTPKITATTA